jgi:hypothetical protein
MHAFHPAPQAVFSRPVIALGSDFGQAGPPAASVRGPSAPIRGRRCPAAATHGGWGTAICMEVAACSNRLRTPLLVLQLRCSMPTARCKVHALAPQRHPTPRAARPPRAAPQVPFTLGCGVPGLSRWVTTTIFRFDPLIDWPADLACELKWNAALKSFDGGPPPAVRRARL